MDPKLKIVLVIVVFIVIIFLVSRSENDNVRTEHYSAAFDPAYVDPRIYPYSRNITFRPDEDLPSIDSTFKIFDHLADQDLGVAQYTGPDDGFYNKNRMSDVMKKRVRFSDEDVIMEATSRPPVRNVDIHTSFSETDINEDRVDETNNIHNYCVREKAEEDYTDKPYADPTHEIMNMDMSDREYYDMVMARTGFKTVMQDDGWMGGQYVASNKPLIKQDIVGLKSITQVMDEYRNNTMDTIRGGYRGSGYVFCNS